MNCTDGDRANRRTVLQVLGAGGLLTLAGCTDSASDDAIQLDDEGGDTDDDGSTDDDTDAGGDDDEEVDAEDDASTDEVDTEPADEAETVAEDDEDGIDDESDDEDGIDDESDDEDDVGRQDTVQMGIVERDGNEIAAYESWVSHLEAETDTQIEPVSLASPAAGEALLADGDLDILETDMFTPSMYPDLVDVIGVRVAFGSAYYFSTITTTPETGVTELGQLEGETISLAAPQSVSGSLVPLWLLLDFGLDVGAAPAGSAVDFEVQYSDHLTALEMLSQDSRIVAAGTGAFAAAPSVPQAAFEEYSDFVEHSAEYDDAGSALADGGDELELLAVSDPIPRAPIVARADWDDPARTAIEDAMVDSSQGAIQADSGEELWFDGLEPATRADYEPILSVIEDLEIDPEDLR